MKTKQTFEADDGTLFETAEECRAHEADAIYNKLAGLTVDQVKAAVTYQDKALGKLLENVGRQCTTARIEAGDASPRGRKKADEPVATETDQQPIEGETDQAGTAEVTSISKRKKAA